MNVTSTLDITSPPLLVSTIKGKEHYLLPATYRSMGFLGLTDRCNVTESGFTGNEVEASTSSFTFLSYVILGRMFTRVHLRANDLVILVYVCTYQCRASAI